MNKKIYDIMAAITVKKEVVKKYFKNETGSGMVEIALIILALLVVAVIFKEQLSKIVTDIFAGFAQDAKSKI